MAEVISLKQGVLKLKDKWLCKLGVDKDGKVLVKVRDDGFLESSGGMESEGAKGLNILSLQEGCI